MHILNNWHEYGPINSMNLLRPCEKGIRLNRTTVYLNTNERTTCRGTKHARGHCTLSVSAGACPT